MNYINYINYISFIIMVTSNHFLKSKFKNYQRWHLLGRTSGGFCDVDLHFVVVILHLSMFFIHIFFSTSSLTLPWTIARFLDPFCTFSPAHRRVICDTFIFNHSVIFLPRARRFWVGIFYPQAFFTSRSFPTFLAQPAFIKASLGTGSYSLKFADLHTDPRNTDPAHLFVWFTVIHNLLYILNLYLYMSILQKFLIVVKTLIKKYRSGAKLISNHKF